MPNTFTPIQADSSRFQFINVNASGKSSDASTQKATKKLVHRHAMRETGKSRRRKKNFPVLVYGSWALDGKAGRPSCASDGERETCLAKARNAQCEFEYSSSSSSTSDNASWELLGSQSELSRLASPNPTTILDSGRTDPFANYPIYMNLNTHHLVDHIHDDASSVVFRPFRDVWFPIAMADPAAFHQILFNSSLHIGMLRKSAGTDSIQTVAHYAAAVRSIQQRLCDPIVGISDGVIGAIIAFGCHDHLVKNFDRWKVHMDGLERIVRMRGGADAIESGPLRLMLLWVDICGSAAIDCKPRFPIPRHLVPPLSLPLQCTAPTLPTSARSLLAIWKTIPEYTPLAAIFEDIYTLTELINIGSANGNGRIWLDSNFTGLRVNPVLHSLLEKAGEPNESLPGITRKACRLAVIIYLGGIRTKFDGYPVPVNCQVGKLKTLLSQYQVGWGPCFDILRLWVLVMGGMGSNKEDDCAWFGGAVSDAIMEMGLRSWDDVLVAVSSFLWIEEIFNTKFERFRCD